MKYVIAYDIGTTGVKTCLFGIDKSINPIADASFGYNLYIMPDGGAEQEFDEWWNAMCITTAKLFENTDITPSMIEGISFCSQMQGLVLMDKNAVPVRRPMSYMDQRAGEEFRKICSHGPQICGVNIHMLLEQFHITNAATTSVKDPLWKYKWVEEHEPENFARTYKWLDVKESLIARCTGEFVMTPDSAYSTFLYDSRPNRNCWSKKLCRMFGVNMDHLPRIIRAYESAGGLSEKAASDLGLMPGTPVFGGGGDATLIGIGTGCVNTGETHVYSGTSGWVSTIIDRQAVDINAMIAGIVGVMEGKFNYFAEMETAGKCLEWVKNHLALDEIGIYLKKQHVAEATLENRDVRYKSLYDYLSEVINTCPAGSNGVIFTPWLHGNRCPFEAPEAGGMFFNIRIDTGKTEMCRAVIEGICFHIRWMLECEDKKIKTSKTIRFAGGGALSDVTSQILADVLQRKIEVVENPQNVGSVGAAAVIGVGLSVFRDIEEAGGAVKIAKTFEPNKNNKAVYDKNYNVFRTLFKNNEKAFKTLNG